MSKGDNIQWYLCHVDRHSILSSLFGVDGMQWLGCSLGQRDAATLCLYISCAHQHGSEMTPELSMIVFDKEGSSMASQRSSGRAEL